MTTTLQALSLVEKAEPVQVRFTLRLRDQHRNAKLGDHGTLNAHNCWFILFHHVWGPAWTKFNLNNIWLRAWAYMASRDTWGSVTTLRGFGGVLGRPLETFFWLSQFCGLGSWLVCEVIQESLFLTYVGLFLQNEKFQHENCSHIGGSVPRFCYQK